MECTNPLNLHHSVKELRDRIGKSKKAGTVPCGRCLACRINRAKEWSIRLVHESFYHEDSMFVTLTYDDDQLPLELDPREAQLFIKRLRKHLGNRKIKYYITGEYGDTTDRCHLHAIIFNLGLGDHKLQKSKNGYQILEGPLSKAWHKGFIFGGTVTPDSTRYVAEYIQKKMYGLPAKDRPQPYALMSQGLGKEWMLEHEEYLRTNLKITFQGKEFPIPKYYREKLELKEDIQLANAFYRQQKLSHYDNKYQWSDVVEAKRAHRVQSNKNLEAFKNIRRKEL